MGKFPKIQPPVIKTLTPISRAPKVLTMIRLMIVDDEMLMIDGMVSMLSDQGDFEVVAKVTDAHKAIVTAGRFYPDIIILDVLMKTGSGKEIATKLKQQLPALKILACSTSTAPRTIEEMLLAGVKGYITKIEPEGELERAFRHILSGRGLFLSQATIIALDDPAAHIDTLTRREREILGYLCHDLIPKQVASSLGLSVKTVYNHIERIREKAAVNNIIQLYPLALREGLVELPG